jgi:hypothetical protein
MNAQLPAEGIMKTNDWGDSRVYRIACNCGDENHNHNMWVEADDCDIQVTIYTTVKSNFWSEVFKPRYDIDNVWLQEFDWFCKGLLNGLITRAKLTWTLWTKGYIDTESSVHLTKQQALNYAETLKSAITDVEDFRKDRQNKEERVTITKMANEQDCV